VSETKNIIQQAGLTSKIEERLVISTGSDKSFDSDMQILKGWSRKWVDIKAGLHILMLAMRNYRSLRKSLKVTRALYNLKKSILGGIQTKIVKLNGKFYHYLYAPAFPSKAFDNYIEAEFHRILPLEKKTNKLTFIIFAITQKCPLQCEHCFEWDNLNKSESLTTGELNAVVSKFQNDGISQFHLSGGEPMVRIKDLEQVIRNGRKQSEFYVLTSGFNFSPDNARKLKQGGLTGVVISLDHFDPEMHNAFRGFHNSFNDVMNAVCNAHEQRLVVALSICVTRSFISWENLLQYATLAKKLNVAFIQLLEPKAVGHYEGKDVFLNKDQLDLLNKFYFTLNFDPAYSDFPIVVYHGYHQRTVGCFSGGNRMLYIDPEGYVHACPFCHTKGFNIKDVIRKDLTVQSGEGAGACPRFQAATL